jgi:hypothetical protein
MSDFATPCLDTTVDLAGLENGELLTAAETAGFEVFLTVDQGIE